MTPNPVRPTADIFTAQHDPAAEVGVLGSVILGCPYDDIRQHVSRGDFFDPTHQQAFDVLTALWSEGEATDDANVFIGKAKEMGLWVDGDDEGLDALFIHRLVNDTPSSANGVFHAKRVAELARLRSLHTTGMDLMRMTQSKSSAECCEYLYTRVDTIAKRCHTGPVVTIMDTIEATEIQWLWRDRFVRRKLNVISGEPGVGKTFLVCDIVARTTNGRGFPDAPHSATTPGGVLLLNAEDDPSDTLRPRLEAAGADLSRVAIVGAANGSPITNISRDMLRIRNAVEAVEDCKLVVIDPVGSYLGGADSHNDAEVRSALGGLVDLAAETGVAVALVAHLRKAGGRAIHRTMGSVAFVGMARAAWLVVEDPEDPRRKLLLRQKLNVSRVTTGLAYRLESHHGDTGTPYVAWEAEAVETSADEVFEKYDAKKRSGKKWNEIQAWLREQLTDGEKTQSDIIEAGAKAGFGEWPIRRAFKAMGGHSLRHHFRGPWWWSLNGQINPGEYPDFVTQHSKNTPGTEF